MMKKAWILVLAAGWGCAAMGVAQEETRVIRPSPAYYRNAGEGPAESGPAPLPPAAAPVSAAPVLSAPVPAPPAPALLPPHPRTASPGPAAAPRALPPHPSRPVSAPASMTPLPVQPRPGQAPAASMAPLPVQPRPGQAPAGSPTAAPALPAGPAVAGPVPARSVQAIPVAGQPVSPVAVPPSPVPASRDQVDFPAAYEEPVYPAAPAARAGDDWAFTLAPSTSARMEMAETEPEGMYWFWGSKWPGLALGPKVGTTGLGADLTLGITRYLNLRSGFNYGSFSWNTSMGSMDYDMDIDMISVPLLVDLYPAGGHFRLVGGLYIQPGTKADIGATPTSSRQIGSHTYPPEVIGTLSGKIDMDQAVTPYLGIGFGNAVGEDRWLTFSLDIGVIFQSYDVTLTSDGAGMTAKLDTFREDLKKEEQNIQKDADKLKFFPVVTLGLSYHF